MPPPVAEVTCGDAGAPCHMPPPSGTAAVLKLTVNTSTGTPLPCRIPLRDGLVLGPPTLPLPLLLCRMPLRDGLVLIMAPPVRNTKDGDDGNVCAAVPPAALAGDGTLTGDEAAKPYRFPLLPLRTPTPLPPYREGVVRVAVAAAAIAAVCEEYTWLGGICWKFVANPTVAPPPLLPVNGGDDWAEFVRTKDGGARMPPLVFPVLLAPTEVANACCCMYCCCCRCCCCCDVSFGCDDEEEDVCAV